MLNALRKAEKSPDKGFKGYPKFNEFGESEELSGKEEEEDDEVMLLDVSSDKASTQGGSKRCQSSQVKEPSEYVSRGFKIPKKTHHTDQPNNHTPPNTSPEKEQCYFSKTYWGLKSSFDSQDDVMKTKLTKSSLKNKQVNVRNIRQMVRRQDASLRLHKEPKISGKRTRKDEPFNDEINQVMLRSKKTSDHNERDSVITTDNCKVVIVDMKVSAGLEEEKKACKRTKSPDKEPVTRDNSSAYDTGAQYLEDLYQENLLELHVPSTSEIDCQQNAISEPKCKEESSTQKTNLGQSKTIAFPSSAATPRHSIHEYSTSEDEKASTNTTSFYGSENKSRVIKTYGSRKSRTINANTSECFETGTSTSDVEEAPVKNSKKRKITSRKNLNKNETNGSLKFVKQKKKHKIEPECLLISSSDEEDNQSGLGDGNVSGTESTMPKTKSPQDAQTSSDNETTEKNHVTTVNGETSGGCKTTGTVDNPFERDSFTTEIMLGPKAMLGTLRGSADGALEITAHQLKWRMKYTDNNDKPLEQVVLILASDLTSFKMYVEKDPKIIVLKVNQRCALKLRGKFSGCGLAHFFDPSSAVVEETEIVLQVDDTLSPETIADIADWVEDRLCKKFTLSHEKAEKLNERLNDGSTDSTSKSDTKQRSHYNTRSSATKSTTRTAVTPTKMIIYPFPPTPGGITVTSADVECLAEGEFLNDVIIDFYLKYIFHDKLNEEDRSRTHIFSSFFYKRLTQKNSLNNPEFFQSPHDRMHSQVKKWTRNVDIFSKDFIIVPINESSHWYLAIICFPNLDKPVVEESSEQEESEKSVVEDSEDSDGKDKEEEEVNVDKDDDEDDTDLETSALAVGAKKATPSKKQAQKNKPIFKANPCILIFDSLANTGRSRVFTNLRNYLSREWKARRPDKPTREFTHQSFKGAFPKVPEQDNHCDCGIFVLQYVESFFEDPIQDYRTPIHKTNWFTHNGISGKRQEIKNLILRLKEKYTSSSS